MQQNRVPAHAPPTDDGRPLQLPYGEPVGTQRWPRIHDEKCPACNGSGIGYKCPECEGKGDFDKGGHTYDCKECGGSGQVDDGYDADKEPCVECDGDGESRYKAVKVGNWHYDRRYLARVEKLPAVKFAQRTEGPADFEDVAVAYFVFDGGEGVLMPMRA